MAETGKGQNIPEFKKPTESVSFLFFILISVALKQHIIFIELFLLKAPERGPALADKITCSVRSNLVGELHKAKGGAADSGRRRANRCARCTTPRPGTAARASGWRGHPGTELPLGRRQRMRACSEQRQRG